jgi:hypothetical protein
MPQKKKSRKMALPCRPPFYDLTIDNETDNEYGHCIRLTSCPLAGKEHTGQNSTSTNFIYPTADGGLAFHCMSSGCCDYGIKEALAELAKRKGPYPKLIYEESSAHEKKVTLLPHRPSAQTNNTTLIIHVWPEPSKEARELCPPISDEREEDVWTKLRRLTTNPNVRRDILVLTCSHNPEMDRLKVEDNFRRENFCEDRVHFEPPMVVTRKTWDAKTRRSEQITITTSITLSCAADVNLVATKCLSGKYSALVIWHPKEGDDDANSDLRYLSRLREWQVRTPIYIFHEAVHPQKWGVEIDGDAERAHRNDANAWETAFPALSDVELVPQEVIVEDFLIAGNIHVLSGPPESYKTMICIELSSASLDERPVFDLLKVNRRCPILFLCADMSQEQLDFYAAPFNLRKHGADFRVMKSDAGIPDITNPILQKAVRGRILALDTMLDFARIQKAFESGEWGTFMENLRDLMKVHGCIAVIMTAHTTRAEVKSDSDHINAGEYFKDSVTFHGKTDIGFGCKVLKGTSQVKLERIKGRGFKRKHFSFTISAYDGEGNSNLDKGRFPVSTLPGDMKELAEQRKAQNKSDPEKQLKLEFLRTLTGSLREKTEALNVKFGSAHGKTTVDTWLQESEFDSDGGEQPGQK